MSSFRRVVSGSLATWVRVGVTLVSQIALVPIYLGHWDPQTYGMWLAVQAAIGLVTIVDTGHQTFLGYEFLRLGADRRDEIARVFYTSIPIALALGLLELGVVFGFVWLGLEGWLFGSGAGRQLNEEAGRVLLLQSFVWLLCGSVGGVAGRLLAPLGYFPRFGWWGVVGGLVTTVCPALAVVGGASLWGAGITLALSTLVFNLPLFLDVWRIMRKEGIHPVAPDWRLGLRNLIRSSLLTLKTLVEMARQQGARLILSPLAGAGEMAAFATMRTGANVALQGLGTITSPLLPELMRFLNRRDQGRSEATFGVVWLTVAAGMAPAVVAVQAVAPMVFAWWTRDKIAFDPVLFAMLSLGVLVYALAQPAMGVVQGHNLLRPQTIVSAVSGAIAVGGMCMLVPLLGIRGAAVALLFAEIASLGGYVFAAAACMRHNGLRWPRGHLAQVFSSVVVAGAGMFALALWPTQEVAILVVDGVLLAGCLWLYWRSFPQIAKTHILELALRRLPFLRSKQG